MIPGGVTETIWYFSGYFHHIDDVVKDRFVYENGGIALRPDDYVLQLRDFYAKADLDDFDTDKIPHALPDLIEEFRDPLLKGPGFPRLPRFEETYADSDDPGRLPGLKKPVIDAMPQSVVPNIAVTYREGGSELQLQIVQFNNMEDDDQLGVRAGSGIESLQTINVEATLDDLVTQATDQTPAALRMPFSSSEAPKFLLEHDQDIASGGHHPDPHSVAPGLYLNGVLQTQPLPETPPEEPAAELDKAPRGEWGMLGGNSATNATLIVDMKEGSNTTIVLGDFYKTNAIVQTNSYIDNDQIAISSGLVENIFGHGNVTTNIANFQQEPGAFAEVSGHYAGRFWNVTVVDGDFYDLNLVLQKNVLRDNDVAVQETQSAHYEAHLGENEQLNLVRSVNGDLQYDLIVIGGSYHSANLIYQHNIILDPDVVKVAADGEAQGVTDQSVAAGGNELVNDAKIITYGDDTFAKPTEDLEKVVDALEARQTSLDLSYGWFVPGNGSSVLNVLYVTGDYYDINAIWQLNVIADVDTGIQFMSKLPSADLPGADSPVTQSMATGGNAATNEAIIVDVGSTAAFIGGDVYQDTILIQGNLVAQNDDKITYGDPSALVSEVVAFTGDDCPEETDVTDAKAPVVPDDTMGSIMT